MLAGGDIKIAYLPSCMIDALLMESPLEGVRVNGVSTTGAMPIKLYGTCSVRPLQNLMRVLVRQEELKLDVWDHDMANSKRLSKAVLFFCATAYCLLGGGADLVVRGKFSRRQAVGDT
jgi:hypothetical protein